MSRTSYSSKGSFFGRKARASRLFIGAFALSLLGAVLAPFLLALIWREVLHGFSGGRLSGIFDTGAPLVAHGLTIALSLVLSRRLFVLPTRGDIAATSDFQNTYVKSFAPSNCRSLCNAASSDRVLAFATTALIAALWLGMLLSAPGAEMLGKSLLSMGTSQEVTSSAVACVRGLAVAPPHVVAVVAAVVRYFEQGLSA